jgi:hypothetical protein
MIERNVSSSSSNSLGISSSSSPPSCRPGVLRTKEFQLHQGGCDVMWNAAAGLLDELSCPSTRRVPFVQTRAHSLSPREI